MYVTHMYYILNIHTLYDIYVRRYVCMYVRTIKQMNEAHTSTNILLNKINVQCRLEAYIYCIRYMSKTMQPYLKLIVPRFDKKRDVLLWFASRFVREAYCNAFCQTRPRFLPARRDSAKRTAFFRENPWIAALYKIAYFQE